MAPQVLTPGDEDADEDEDKDGEEEEEEEEEEGEDEEEDEGDEGEKDDDDDDDEVIGKEPAIRISISSLIVGVTSIDNSVLSFSCDDVIN